MGAKVICDLGWSPVNTVLLRWSRQSDSQSVSLCFFSGGGGEWGLEMGGEGLLRESEDTQRGEEPD